MPWRKAVTNRVLDLPPIYDPIALREVGDAFTKACAIAGERGAGTLLWVRRYDLAEFAVVLAHEKPLAGARRARYIGMNAPAAALSVPAPPDRPVTSIGRTPGRDSVCQ